MSNCSFMTQFALQNVNVIHAVSPVVVLLARSTNPEEFFSFTSFVVKLLKRFRWKFTCILRNGVSSVLQNIVDFDGWSWPAPFILPFTAVREKHFLVAILSVWNGLGRILYRTCFPGVIISLILNIIKDLYSRMNAFSCIWPLPPLMNEFFKDQNFKTSYNRFHMRPKLLLAGDRAKSSDESIVDCMYAFKQKSQPDQIFMTSCR